MWVIETFINNLASALQVDCTGNGKKDLLVSSPAHCGAVYGFVRSVEIEHFSHFNRKIEPIRILLLTKQRKIPVIMFQQIGKSCLSHMFQY